MTQDRTRIGLGLAALIVYLWVIHSYKLAIGDVATLALGLGVLLRGAPIRFPAPVMWLGAFILWNAVGLSVTTLSVVTWKVIIVLVKIWVILVGIVNVVRNAADLRVFAIAWLALFALYPVRGAFYNQYWCHCTESGRVSWNFIFSNPNDLAAFCLILIGLAAGVAVVERVKFFRYSALIGVAVLVLVVMLTQSRGAMLAVGVTGLRLLWGSKRRVRDVTLLVVLFGVAAVAAPRDVWMRLAGLANVSVSSGMQGVDPERSAESRWLIWQIAFRAFEKNPIVGVGPGMMPEVHRWEAARMNAGSEVQGVRDTHSTYLRIAAENGIPGLVLFMGIWFSLLNGLRRTRQRIKEFRPKDAQFLLYFELSITAYLIAAIFGTYGTLSFTYLAVAMAWLSAHILETHPWHLTGAELVPAPATRVARSRAG